MSATPYLTWSTIGAVNYMAGAGNVPSPGYKPPSLTLAHGAGVPPGEGLSNVVHISVQVSGDPTVPGGGQEVSFTGQVNGGSDLLQPVSSLSGLYVGQLVQQPNPFDGGFWIPNGVQIVGLGSTPTLWAQITGEGIATTTSVPLVAVDFAPCGSLAVTVTPGTGVQLFDWNFDNTTAVSTEGSATAISSYQNSDGHSNAQGSFYAAFGSAGSFSMSVAYTSTDTNYGNASIQYPLLITAT